MIRTLAAFALLVPGAVRSQAHNTPDSTAVAAATDTLRAALLEANHDFFDALFAACDVDRVNRFLTDDVEFYDDRTGQRTGDDVRADFARLADNCPAGNGVRRMLLPHSVEVYPIRGVGALQLGSHHFVERGASSSTTARFVILWRQTRAGWQMSRIMSVDHQSVPAGEAEAMRRRAMGAP